MPRPIEHAAVMTPATPGRAAQLLFFADRRAQDSTHSPITVVVLVAWPQRERRLSIILLLILLFFFSFRALLTASRTQRPCPDTRSRRHWRRLAGTPCRPPP